MFDEPDQEPTERSIDLKSRVREKVDELCMYAELAAVFEGKRKFDARLVPGLDIDLARQVQRQMARLERAKTPESPVLPAAAVEEAAGALRFGREHGLSGGDYHIHRRTGETMIVRRLEGAQVETFYERLQAHFDAGLEGFREDERQAQQWKQDPATLAFLDAMDAVRFKTADWYLRDLVVKRSAFVLSARAADEMNISWLTDHVMGVTPAEIVGRISAPPDDPTERDLAWFFKLFSLRGKIEDVEQMCFFTFLQKSDDPFGEE